MIRLDDLPRCLRRVAALAKDLELRVRYAAPGDSCVVLRIRLSAAMLRPAPLDVVEDEVVKRTTLGALPALDLDRLEAPTAKTSCRHLAIGDNVSLAPGLVLSEPLLSILLIVRPVFDRPAFTTARLQAIRVGTKSRQGLLDSAGATRLALCHARSSMVGHVTPLLCYALDMFYNFGWSDLVFFDPISVVLTVLIWAWSIFVIGGSLILVFGRMFEGPQRPDQRLGSGPDTYRED